MINGYTLALILGYLVTASFNRLQPFYIIFWPMILLSLSSVMDKKGNAFKWFIEPFFFFGFILEILIYLISLTQGMAFETWSAQAFEAGKALFFFSPVSQPLIAGVLPGLPLLWMLPAFYFTYELNDRLTRGKTVWLWTGILYIMAACLAFFEWIPQSWLLICQGPFYLQGYRLLKEKKILNPKNAALLFSSGLLWMLITGGIFSLSLLQWIVIPVLVFSLMELLSPLQRKLNKKEISLKDLIRWMGWTGAFLFLIPQTPAGLKLVLTLASCGIAALAVAVQKRMDLRKKEEKSKETARDQGMDFFRGILILSMVAGHFMLDENSRSFIYSYHMPAFLFSSGWFYRPLKAYDWKGFTKRLVSLGKAFLVPYLGSQVLLILLHPDQVFFLIKRAVLAMGYVRVNFYGISWERLEDYLIGPIYFLLLLFLVRLMVLVLDALIHSKSAKGFVIFLLVILGLKLGESGLWLPWSLDEALVCLAFYMLGAAAHRFSIMDWLDKNKTVYYLLILIWVSFIVNGSFELALRYYGENFEWSLLATLCASLCLYFFSKTVCSKSGLLSGILIALGNASLYVLIVHSLSNDFCWRFFGPFFGSQTLLAASWILLLQCSLGLLVNWLVSGIVRSRKSLLAG